MANARTEHGGFHLVALAGDENSLREDLQVDGHLKWALEHAEIGGHVGFGMFVFHAPATLAIPPEAIAKFSAAGLLRLEIDARFLVYTGTSTLISPLDAQPARAEFRIPARAVVGLGPGTPQLEFEGMPIDWAAVRGLFEHRTDDGVRSQHLRVDWSSRAGFGGPVLSASTLELLSARHLGFAITFDCQPR